MGWKHHPLAMVEITSVCEVKQQLPAADRLHLIQTLNALPGPQFDELVFALPPPSNIPGNSAPQCNRSVYLLQWVERSWGHPSVQHVSCNSLVTFLGKH